MRKVAILVTALAFSGANMALALTPAPVGAARAGFSGAMQAELVLAHEQKKTKKKSASKRSDKKSERAKKSGGGGGMNMQGMPPGHRMQGMPPGHRMQGMPPM